MMYIKFNKKLISGGIGVLMLALSSTISYSQGLDPCLDPNAPGCGERIYDNVRYSCVQSWTACAEQGDTSPYSPARRYGGTTCTASDSRYPHLANSRVVYDYYVGAPYPCDYYVFSVCSGSGACYPGSVRYFYTQVN